MPFLIFLIITGLVLRVVSLIWMPTQVGKLREPYTGLAVGINALLNLGQIAVAVWILSILFTLV